MKPLLLVAALALPIPVAATVAMEPQQAVRPADASRSSPAGAGTHRPLFVVRYVLRRAPSDSTPTIVMDDSRPQLQPPGKDYPATSLGAGSGRPNVLICYGWGCQQRP